MLPSILLIDENMLSINIWQADTYNRLELSSTFLLLYKLSLAKVLECFKSSPE